MYHLESRNCIKINQMKKINKGIETFWELLEIVAHIKNNKVIQT